MVEKKPKGPSLSALAALTTLAIALWMEVDLATALFRSVLVYLLLSMVSLAYRVILGRFIASSQRKAEAELLEKVQREAEEEERKRQEQQQEPARVSRPAEELKSAHEEKKSDRKGLTTEKETVDV